MGDAASPAERALDRVQRLAESLARLHALRAAVERKRDDPALAPYAARRDEILLGIEQAIIEAEATLALAEEIALRR